MPKGHSISLKRAAVASLWLQIDAIISIPCIWSIIVTWRLLYFNSSVVASGFTVGDTFIFVSLLKLK